MEKIALFVYGTLKQGYSNFDNFCSGANQIIEAKVSGNIYNYDKGFSGFPVAKIPNSSIFSKMSQSLGRDLGAYLELVKTSKFEWLFEEEGFGQINGELMIFEDTPSNLQERFSALDYLENINPKAGISHLGYTRVVTVAETKDGKFIPCFMYILETQPKGDRLMSGTWPESVKKQLAAV